MLSYVSTTPESSPSLYFNHLLSKVVINLSTDEVSLADAKVVTYSSSSIDYDLATGNYEVSNGLSSILMASNGTNSFKAIVVPRDVVAGDAFAAVEIDGVTYEVTSPSALSFASGCQYTFNLVISSNVTTGEIEIAFGDATIGDWEDGNSSEDEHDDYAWSVYTSDDGSTTGVWTDDLMGWLFGGYTAVKNVTVYYTDDVPGLYRIDNIYTGDFSCQIWGCTEDEEIGCAIDPTITTISTYIHAENPDAVWIEYHDSGYYIGSDYGNFYYGSYCNENFSGLDEESSIPSIYGTMVDGYISFPASAMYVYLDIYNGAWLGGYGELSLALPGASVPTDTPNYNSTLTEGTYTMSGYSYFDSAWYDEEITISYVDASTGEISIAGMFYGYSDALVTGYYDATAQTISIPDWQLLGEFDFGDYGVSDVYFANATDATDIVFTLDMDGETFATEQWWGYYADALSAWYDLYSASNIVVTMGDGTEFKSGSYVMSGYSYFYDTWNDEPITISSVDASTGEATITGLFYGFSEMTVSAVYDDATKTISIPDWQNLGEFDFGDSGVSNVYLANANDESDIVFTLNDEGIYETEQWWGYYLETLGGWYDAYSASTITPASTSYSVKADAPYSIVSSVKSAKAVKDVKSLTAVNKLNVVPAKVSNAVCKPVLSAPSKPVLSAPSKPVLSKESKQSNKALRTIAQSAFMIK